MKKLLPLICLVGAVYGDVMMEPELFPKVEMGLEMPIIAPHKSPVIAVGLSTLMPGLGHLYLGDYTTASGLMGSTGLYAGLCVARPDSEGFVQANLSLITCNWFYGIYAAYRDVRGFNGGSYCYEMPRESLAELAMAPFQWSVMKKREVWLALLVDLSLAVGLGALIGSGDEEFRLGKSGGEASFPLMAFPVGIGEESFFRGFLQSCLAERFSPWGGIALSSLAFGAAHIPNGMELDKGERGGYYSVILPFITLSSLYYGWVTYKNGSLKEAVALHSWYDFTIFLASYGLSKSVRVGQPFFAFSMPF